MSEQSMTHQAAYLDAARDASRSAMRLLSAGEHPTAAFMAIHAFESAGRAFLLDAGRAEGNYHSTRMTQFAAVAGSYGHGHGLMNFAAQAIALRNQCIYPTEQSDGAFLAPQEMVTARAAQQLASRARGVVRMVEKALS